MSRVAKTNPVGVDKVIDRIQENLYSYLTSTVGWSDYESYHRAYKNRRIDRVIPEVYTGSNEYKEVLFNDKYNVTSYFLASDTASEEDGVFDHEISLVVQAKLDQLYGSVTHRADEELRKDVIVGLKDKAKALVEGLEVVTGLLNVYEDIDIDTMIREGSYNVDMSNFHVVKFDFTVRYRVDECGTSIL